MLLTVGLVLVELTRRARSTTPLYHPEFKNLPQNIDGYKATQVPVDDEIKQYLQPETMRTVAYKKDQDKIAVSAIYGVNWRSIHAPTSCLPAQGWTIVYNEVAAIPAPPDCPHDGPLQTRQVYAVKGRMQQVMLLVYARPGATTTNWTMHALHMAVGSRGAGGVIIMLTRRVHGGDYRLETAILRRILKAIYPHIVSFWYQDNDRR